MTPKEKAKYLINRMNNVDLNCKNESMCMLYPHAIECALICIDEILKLNKKATLEILEFYKEVREEIINVEKSI